MEGGREARSVVAAHQGLVRSFFARRCRSREDAEDLAQETFCAILAAYPRFRRESAVSTWIWGICRNVYAHHLYTGRRRERILSRLAAEFASEQALREADRGLGREETGRDLALLVKSLGPDEGRLFELHYERGLPIRETALLLERPEGTVKYQLSRLRARLRILLAEGGRKR